MTSPAPTDSRVRFGVFELDLKTGELRKAGVLLHLPPQPARVLALLVSRPAQLITREEIRKQIWGEGTNVDFEHGLNFAIKKIRDTLGDDPGAPRYIETLPRRGHRFIAPVQAISASAVLPELVVEGTVAGGTRPGDPSRKRRKVLMIIGIILALAATLAGFNVGGLRYQLRGDVFWRNRVSLPRIEAIAVLPFENVSGEPTQEYFADGMTEELVTSLGRIGGLRVISRQSIMRFKGSRKPLPEIARELNVDGIVEGTVARSGNHVRITANLLNAATDRHLWANSYDSELEDLLVVEGKVARAIAVAVRIELMPQEQLYFAGAHQLDPDAYQAYLEGRYYLSQLTEEGFKNAVAHFREAIDLDPTYARAYEGLAEVHSFVGMFGLKPATEIFPLAKADALRALELDNGLADSHAVLGLVNLVFDQDWSGADRSLKRAVTLNPNSSTAHIYYGLFLAAMGRSDEAIRETRQALDLDPLTPSTNLQLGWVLFYARRYDESIAQLQKTLQLAPDFGYANMELGWNYAQKRMYSEAVTECQRAVSLMPEDQVTLGSCGRVYGAAGRRQDALKLLDRLKNASAGSSVDAYNVAWLYDGLGDTDRAMAWLERAYRERSASLYGLRVEWFSDQLRSDPRFQDLLRRLSFPP